MLNKLPKIALVGRTNVGKSTLFNTLTEKKLALTSPIEGTTRDIKTSSVIWRGKVFELVDTGGLTGENFTHKIKKTKAQVKSEDDINKKIIEKALQAVHGSDLVILVTDIKSGLTAEDRAIARYLMLHHIPAIVAVNKADNYKKLSIQSAQFYKLGFADVIPISAITGAGTGDLLDKVLEYLPDAPDIDIQEDNETDYKENIKVAIIGRPNVGKSTLINRLTKSERSIVSPIPHTTREPLDTTFKYKDTLFTFVDTAGIRRKSKIDFKSLEKQSTLLSLKTLKQADVVVLVLDLSADIGHQDLKLAQLALKSKRAIVIVGNKTDALSKNADKEYIAASIKETFNFVDWSEVVLISALSGKNVQKIYDVIVKTYSNFSAKIDDDRLNSLKTKLVQKQPPPHKRGTGKRPKILHLIQISSQPPHFEIVYKGVGMLPFSYLKYFENHIRKKFKLSGTPIIMSQRKI